MSDVTRGQIGLGMGGHHEPHRGKNDEWLTPPEVLASLGHIDLDPCAPVNRPWPMADKHYTILDDGLRQEWNGFVFVNPPYGPQTWKWLDRLASHPEGGIALTFARTETAGFVRSAWKKANAILFLHGRLYFHYVDGQRAAANSGAPSCLIAYGEEAVHRLAKCGLPGSLVRGWSN